MSSTGKSAGSIISVSDYNDVATRLNTTFGIGAGQFGYGGNSDNVPLANLPAVSDKSLIQNEDWLSLKRVFEDTANFQNVTLPDVLPDDSILEDGDIATFSAGLCSEDNMLILENNRFNIPSDRYLSTVSILSSTRTTQWRENIRHEFKVIFPSADAARFFFNKGGELTFNASRSGGSTNDQNTEWTNFLAAESGFKFGREDYYNLTSTFQPFAEKEKVIVGTGVTVPAYNLIVDSTAINFNLYDELVDLGWDGVTVIKVDLTINPGTVIGSSSISEHSFTTGGPYPDGTEINIDNKGIIVGRGGYGANGGAQPEAGNPGGPAMEILFPVNIINTGIIGGGGGGGARNGCVGCNWSGTGGIGTVSGGGGGAGYRRYDGTGLIPNEGNPTLELGGIGVGGGANGGDLGQAGGDATALGGAAGNAIDGTVNITFVGGAGDVRGATTLGTIGGSTIPATPPTSYAYNDGLIKWVISARRDDNPGQNSGNGAVLRFRSNFLDANLGLNDIVDGTFVSSIDEKRSVLVFNTPSPTYQTSTELSANFDSILPPPPVPIIVNTRFVANLTISSDVLNYNVKNKLTTLGWDGSEPAEVTLEVLTGVIVGSNNTGIAAIDATLPLDSILRITNRGTIVGKGGNGGNAPGNYSNGNPGEDGGTALKLSAIDVSIDNQGNIWGGGGGGGSGGKAGGNSYGGAAGGGGGAGNKVGSGGSFSGGNHTSGGTASHDGTLTSGGAGGHGGKDNRGSGDGGNGGNGGSPGSAGSAGTKAGGGGGYGGAGGKGGTAIKTGNARIAWISGGSAPKIKGQII